MNEFARFCTHCGSPLKPGVRFCGQCGHAVQASVAPGAPAYTPRPPAYAAPVVAAPIAAPPAEPMVGIIAGLQQRKGFLGMSATTFNLIVTPGRLVFASVSQQMMNDAVAAARQEAKGQGKGFLGRFAAQFAWMDQICRQYSTMPIDAILAQFPGSFCILNAQVRKVRLRDSRVDDDGTQSSQELFIESAAGKFRFSSSMMRVREARQILRQTLGRIVK